MGFVKIELLDHCASDLAVANAARVSLDKWHEEFQDGDDKLIGFLMRERHGSPFEHGYFQFRVEAPIFVLREWQRHRAGHSYNEMSGRYTEMEKKFHVPETFRVQVGRPGAYTFVDDGPNYNAQSLMEGAYEIAWQSYKGLLDRGIAKEQARAVLPLGLYSKMIWSCNPRSLMHFLSLRMNLQAMKEIRDLATCAWHEFANVMPVTAAAFEANGWNAP